MVFDVGVAMTWILFLALFPITFFWLRRAWRIGVQRDFSEVALKHGNSPQNPAKFAPHAFVLNLIAGSITLATIVLVLAGAVEYQTWSAIAGSTLWMKLVFEFILSRHAHPIAGRKQRA